MKSDRNRFSVLPLLLIVSAAVLLAAGGYRYFVKAGKSKPAPAANQIAPPVSQSQASSGLHVDESADDLLTEEEDEACTDLLKLPPGRLKKTRLPADCGKTLDIGNGFKNWKYVSFALDDLIEGEFAEPTLALWDGNGKFIQKIVDASDGMLLYIHGNFNDDVNYDGYKDLKIMISSGPVDVEIELYDYWIFNPKSKLFHKDPVLTHVENPVFDKNGKRIYSKVGQNNGCFYRPKCSGWETVYHFADGKWRRGYRSGELPKFEDFPVKEIFTGKPAAVDFSKDAEAKKFNESGGANGDYKGLIAAESAKGPNFNGHYRIIDWNCGADCRSALIVDVATGVIAYSPFIKQPNGIYDPLDLSPWKDLDCRINSSLMAVNGKYYDIEFADGLSLPFLVDVKDRMKKPGSRIKPIQ
jgi:hypothetical protein